MVLIVGNSLVKKWISDNDMTICLPRAPLSKSVETTKDEMSNQDKIMFIQSGIQDLHSKGVRNQLCQNNSLQTRVKQGPHTPL